MAESWSYEKIITEARNKKISESRKGSKNPMWKGGPKVPRDVKNYIRKSREYKKWRRDVFERDKYVCQDCGASKCYLEAHHIKGFADYPHLRFEITNGLTLCRPCHRKK